VEGVFIGDAGGLIFETLESSVCGCSTLFYALGLAKVDAALDGDVTEFEIFVVAVLGAHYALQEWGADVPLLEVAVVSAAFGCACGIVHWAGGVVGAGSDDHAGFFLDHWAFIGVFEEVVVFC
jgi:hypothetical protein